MRKLCLLSMLLLFPALPVGAADPTYELLSAPHVKSAIRIHLTQDKKFQYSKDRMTTTKDLDDNKAFVLDDQADLVFHGFNPFTVSIATSEKTEDDPNFGSLGKFLDAAQKLGEAIVPAGGGARAAPVNEVLALRRGMSELQRFEAAAAGADPCAKYADIHKTLKDLHQEIGTVVVTAADLQAWRQGSRDGAGVTIARGGIASKIQDLANHQQATEEFLQQLGKAALLDQNGTELKCTTGFKPSTFALVADIGRRLQESLTLRREITSRLEALHKYLAKFEDPNLWPAGGDYIFLKPRTAFEKIKLVTVSVRQREFVPATFEVKESDPVSVTLRLRQHSLFVPELGVGPVYTELEFPKYGTKQEDGRTVVALAGTEDEAIKTAMMLNLTWRLPYTSPVYPGFQLGLTQNEDYPGLLAGFLIRFTRPRPLALSVGKIFAWYKDLDKLKPGDPVAGTADIEADLDLTRTKATYISIQYTF